MEVIFILFIVLGIVTLVGHGIWVAIAFIVRLGGPPSDTGHKQPRSCPWCDAQLIGKASSCVSCGWPRGTDSARRAASALNALRQKVQRFERMGMLERGLADRLVEQLQAEIKKLDTSAIIASTPTSSIAPPQVSVTTTAEVVDAQVIDEPTSTVVPPVPPPPEEYVVRESRPGTVDELNQTVAQRMELFVRNESSANSTSSHSALRTPHSPPPPPSRPLSETLLSFLEEKNIRWGELIGGLLIVGSSIALVLSFWSEIAARPLLKFGLFNGVIAGLFGLGHYIHRHWKLANTSQGLLIIATLLVPLNFLAITAFTQQSATIDTLTLVGELASIALFAVLVYLTGHVITPGLSWPLVITVLGCATSQFLIRRTASPELPQLHFWGVGLVPALTYALPLTVVAWRAMRLPEFTLAALVAQFKLLGLASFAALLAIVLLAVRTDHFTHDLGTLAPLLPIVAWPSMLLGLVCWRRADDATLIAWRTTGTAIAVLGAILSLAAIALAWPHPALIVVVALINFVLVSLSAWRFDLPAGHVLAAGALACAYTFAMLVVLGRVEWDTHDARAVIDALGSAHSGTGLMPLVVTLGLAAAVWQRSKRLVEAQCYAAIAGVAALASLALVTCFGLGRAVDGGATYVYLIYALGAVCAGWATRRAELTWTGSALGLVAAIQAVVFRFAEAWSYEHPWLVALLIHAGTTIVVGSIVRWVTSCSRTRQSSGSPPLSEPRTLASSATASSSAVETSSDTLLGSVIRPLEQSGIGTSLAAAFVLAALCFSVQTASTLLVYPVVLSVLWGIGAVAGRDHAQFTFLQIALTWSALLASLRWLESQAWYEELGRDPLDPWSLQTFGIVFAGLGIGWVLVRHAARRWGERHDRWQVAIPQHLTFDRMLNVATLVLLAGLAFYAVIPGTLRELSTVNVTTQLGLPDAFENSYAHARGTGAWLFWLAGLALLIVRLTEGFRAWLVVVGVGVLWLICPLAAAESVGAVASAWRWWCGGFLIVATTIHLWRDTLAPLTARLGWPADELRSPAAVRFGRITALTLGGAPIVLGSSLLIAQLAVANLTQSVAADSFFGRIGLGASHLIPLAALVVALLAMAVRDRVAGLALAAGCTLHGITTLAYLLWPERLAGRDELLQLFEWSQLNALVGGAYLLLSFVVLRRIERREQRELLQLPTPLWAQQWLAVAAFGIFAILSGWGLFFDPTAPLETTSAAGPLAWISLVVTIAAWLGPQYAMRGELPVGRVTWCALATGVLLAFTVSTLSPTSWLGFHVWQVTLVATAVGLLAVAKRRWSDELLHIGYYVTGVWALLSATGLRGIFRDPLAPWWATSTLFTACLLGAVLAAWQRTRWRVVPAALMLWPGVVIHPVSEFFASRGGLNLSAVLMITISTLTLPCVGWVWLDRRWIVQDDLSRARGMGWHRVAPILSLVLFALWLTIGGFEPDVALHDIGLTWFAWGCMIVAVVATAWDPHTRAMPFTLYLVGLQGVALGVSQVAALGNSWLERTQTLLWIAVSFVAAYSILTSYLWSRRRELRAFVARLGMPVDAREGDHELNWLVPANVLLALGVLAGATLVDFTFASQAWRIAAGKAALLQVVSLGLLSRGNFRSSLQRGTLLFGALAAIVWAWAWLPHTLPLVHLDRLVAGTLALVVCVGLYGLGLIKILRRENEWTAAAQSLTPLLVAGALVGVAAVLGLEVAQQVNARVVIISPWAASAMIGVLAGLVVLALSAALVPGRDPLQLSESGRTTYVYAAEVLLGLLFLHLRLSLPWLFGGVFDRYWPLIVMALAFVGVGMSELFRRQQRRVLYEPLERSAALLPLLPVLGFWVASSQVDYSWTMIIIGGLYGVLAILRQSFGYSMLAALAANGALWYYLGRIDGFGLHEHPQLWLIPPAVCVLIAAQLNRSRLSAQQLTTIRYLTSAVVYVSSTADIFLRGVREAPWLPLVLGAFSIAGMLLGIALRVRAFLFLGATFLVIALASIIKYAAVDLEQTWLWSVTGIVTGALILALFGLFEKKRNEILKLVDDLRRWEG